MNQQSKKNEVKILQQGECASLGNQTTICYSVGLDGKNVMLKIDNISSSAIFNSYWVNVNDILDVLNDAQEPFSSSILQPTFKGRSVNTACLVMGVARHLKWIVPDNKRRFIKGDSKGFLDSIQKIIKPPAKKTPKKKNAKA